MRGLNMPLDEKRATVRHFLLLHPLLVFPIALLRENKRDIGKIKRAIGRIERAIGFARMDSLFAKGAFISARARRFPEKIQKKSSPNGLFSHLQAGVARPKESPPKISQT